MTLQRRGTWLIDGRTAKHNRKPKVPKTPKDIEIELITKARDLTPEEKTSLLKELEGIPNYFDEFAARYPRYEILGMQGCGNLTMNEWFVALLDSQFTSYRYRSDGHRLKRDKLPIQEIRLLHRLCESYDERSYSCLVLSQA